MAKRQTTTEKKEEQEIPKLNASHFKEITELVKKYGGTLKVLAYWHAVMLDENGRVKCILDHSMHGERDMQRYEDLEPLKGIKYLGQGYITYTPYVWCTEWLRQWEWWVNENKHLPEVKPLLAKPERLTSLKLNLQQQHVH